MNAKYDVIIFPEDSTATITGEGCRRSTVAAGEAGWWTRWAGLALRQSAAALRSGGGGGGGGGSNPHASGISHGHRRGRRRGAASFVEKGGTLVTLGGASNFAIERFGLSVRDAPPERRPRNSGAPAPR